MWTIPQEVSIVNGDRYRASSEPSRLQRSPPETGRFRTHALLKQMLYDDESGDEQYGESYRQPSQVAVYERADGLAEKENKSPSNKEAEGSADE